MYQSDRAAEAPGGKIMDAEEPIRKLRRSSTKDIATPFAGIERDCHSASRLASQCQFFVRLGAAQSITGTATLNARFPGQWFQSESGLHQNWMRDYDPTTGRYLQADPLGLVDRASVYGYVKGNPGWWIDPRGLARARTH